MAILLGACGGGDSGGDDGVSYSGPTARVTIDSEASAVAVAGDTKAVLFGDGGMVGRAGPGATIAGPAGGIVGQLDAMTTTRTAAMARVIASGNCPGGGSGRVTESGTLGTAGYSYSETWDNCSFPELGVRYDGSYDEVLKSITGDPDSGDDWSAAWSIAYGALKTEYLATGDYRLKDGRTSLEESFDAGDDTESAHTRSSSMYLDTRYHGVRHQVLMQNYEATVVSYGASSRMTFSLSGKLSAGDLGGSVLIDVTTPFDFPTGIDGTPTAGQITITGANEAKVQLTVVGGNVEILYDVNPIDGAWDNDGSPIVQGWAGL